MIAPAMYYPRDPLKERSNNLLAFRGLLLMIDRNEVRFFKGNRKLEPNKQT
jgi:hypothetical protein